MKLDSFLLECSIFLHQKISIQHSFLSPQSRTCNGEAGAKPD